ncbi:hypothetical protein VTO73DRAFT_6429 [Trametes versicolor]
MVCIRQQTTAAYMRADWQKTNICMYIHYHRTCVPSEPRAPTSSHSILTPSDKQQTPCRRRTIQLRAALGRSYIHTFPRSFAALLPPSPRPPRLRTV